LSKIGNIKTRIFVFLNDKNKKNYLQILKEILVLTVVKKEIPLYYFAKFLYRKEIVDYRDYLSQKETRNIVRYIKPNDTTYINLVRNKLDFSYFLEEKQIATPKVIAHNIKNEFQLEDKIYKIFSHDDLHFFLEKIMNTSTDNQLFVKPFSEQGGKDCFILKNDTLEQVKKEHLQKILFGDFLFQECIKQHSTINAINPDTINSIRFNSCTNESGEVHILSAFMRFGRNGNVVDNGSSGGFYVAVDLETGELAHEGKQLMRFGGNVFYKHPDTKYNFSNFKIPFFKEACSLVCETAAFIPIKMLGWDIAITDKEPVLIEANDNFSLFVADIAYRGYLKHPLIKEINKKLKNA